MKRKPHAIPSRSNQEPIPIARRLKVLAVLSGVLLLFTSPASRLQSQSQSAPTAKRNAASPQGPTTTPPTNQPSLNVTNILADIAITQTNDPFASSSVMVQKATIGDTATATVTSSTGSANLKLHGVVIGDNGNTLALISLDKSGIHVVREGDQLSLSTGSRAGKVSITAIHRKSVEIEYGTFDNSVTIR